MTQFLCRSQVHDSIYILIIINNELLIMILFPLLVKSLHYPQHEFFSGSPHPTSFAKLANCHRYYRTPHIQVRLHRIRLWR